MSRFRRRNRSITTMPPPGRDMAGPILPLVAVRPVTHPVALQERIELLSMKLDLTNGEMRGLERRNRKLQERLNRISNAMIGNQRIWVLDRLAMENEVEADSEQNHLDITVVSDRHRALKENQIRQFRTDALFLRRLEFDLGVLRVAVNGDTNWRGGKYDQANWKGSRP